MKILFVGVLDIPWSTHIPMKREFEKRGHVITTFNYRTIANSYVSDKDSLYYKFKDKLGSFLRRPFMPEFSRRLYYYINGRRQMNEALLKELRNSNYDLVFLGKADGIDYGLIPEINKYARTWYFFMDPLSQVYRVSAQSYAKRCTWSSATFLEVSEIFNKSRARSFFITQGVDTEIFYPVETKKNLDVIFVGTYSKRRKRFIDYLIKSGISVKLYGEGFENGPIYQKELTDKYRQAKIILNLKRKGTGFSIRVFQAMGTGTFLLSKYCYDLEQIFIRKKHLDWFKSPEECSDLIRHYLVNEKEREKIAASGCKYVLENHSWGDKIGKILEVIEKIF